MKHLNKTLLSLLLVFAVTGSAMAQQAENRDAEGKILRGPYETNRFFDNFFVSAAGGVNVYHGENDSYGSFGKRLAPALDIAFGKWITPSVAVRIQYSGLKAKGWTMYESIYAKEAVGDGMFKEKFGVMNLHADVMWNISNAIGGYKECRTWDFVPFVGAGWALSYGDHHKNSLGVTVGLLNEVRLCRLVDLTIEARHLFVAERFDGVVRGSKSEGMTSVTLGLSFNLGSRRFKRIAPPIDVTNYEKQIETLAGSNELLNDKAAQLAAELEAAKNLKPQVIEGDTKIVASPVALFFKINKATLDEKELTNLDFYVKNAIRLDKEKVFTLIGSADKDTGNATINQKLSEKRMQYVHNLLITKYGVSEDRLKTRADGDRHNRFSAAELNRVVVVE
ncbi:MAG: OmpA family protein [Alistipes sp.]